MTTPAGFFERWSRLKRERESPPADDPAVAAPRPESVSPPIAGSAEVGEVSERAVQPPAPPVAELPKIEELDLTADFSGFLKKEVSESLRRAALRKLFNDPHFNRMDGLDIYIDDYSRSDPIPPEMMKKLQQFRTYLSDEKDEDRDSGMVGESAPAAELDRAATEGESPRADDAPPEPTSEISAQDCDSLARVGQVVPEAETHAESTRKIEDPDA
jgi:hypothetical protein